MAGLAESQVMCGQNTYPDPPDGYSTNHPVQYCFQRRFTLVCEEDEVVTMPEKLYLVFDDGLVVVYVVD